MKGYVFTIDSIIALGFVVIIIFSFFLLSYQSFLPERGYESLNILARDTRDVLNELKVDDVKEKPTFSRQISDGLITPDDLDRTVLDIIGSFWISGNQTIAKNMTSEILDSFFPGKCYSLQLENELIHASCFTNGSDIAISTSLESGYEFGKPVSGFLARGVTNKIGKNNTLVVKGDVIRSSVKKPGAGNNLNKPNVTYVMRIPDDSTPIYSFWFIEAAWVDTKFKAFINGESIPGSDASGSKLLEDLNSFLQPGNNFLTVEYRFGGGGEEGGDDGASHFVLNYSTPVVNTLLQNRFPFALVDSNASIRYKKPIFVIGDINTIDINLNLISTNATLGFIKDDINFTISK